METRSCPRSLGVSAITLSVFVVCFSIARAEWGDEQGGLQCQISSPAEIEQGMPLELEILLRSHPRNLRPGTKALNAFLRDAFLELTLTNLDSREVFAVRPYDPTRGMPVLDEGKETIPLDGTAIKPWRVSFPLATVFDSLSPGAYECQVRYSFPDKPTSWWRGTAEQWQTAGFWHGNVTSGTFPLSIEKQSAETQAILLPERLRAEISRDEGGRTRTLVRFRKRDAKHVALPTRNGHFLGWKAYQPSEPGHRMQSGTPRPDSANPIAEWFEGKSGEKVLVTIEVFETAVAAHHHWAPERSGFKVLWKKTFTVSVKDETALPKHDVTIAYSSAGPFNGWALGHDEVPETLSIERTPT
ncbi:MAG: hypothetical protein H8E44_48055 [Planctomycetes bacterium]|nr:hypothetical protein [Planctomycetota bacterium]MBL7037877.1 hypothetical protein [Pirellulaceae bacterium]